MDIDKILLSLALAPDPGRGGVMAEEGMIPDVEEGGIGIGRGVSLQIEVGIMGMVVVDLIRLLDPDLGTINNNHHKSEKGKDHHPHPALSLLQRLKSIWTLSIYQHSILWILLHGLY
jgi:hypothetical protein